MDEWTWHRPSDDYIDAIIEHGPPQVGQIVYSLAMEVKMLREAMLAAARRTVDDSTRDRLEAALSITTL